MQRAKLTRRSLLASAALAAAAPPAYRLLRERGYDRERRRAYRALIDALLRAGALPAAANAAPAATDRLGEVYATALPRRRTEIDAVLDALGRAGFADLAPRARLGLLRRWAAAGGERRVVAARALALAGAAFGPADRPLPVVI